MDLKGYKNLNFQPDLDSELSSVTEASTSKALLNEIATTISNTSESTQSDQSYNNNNKFGSHDLKNYKQGSNSNSSLENYNNSNNNNNNNISKSQRITDVNEINLTSLVNEDMVLDGKKGYVNDQSVANLSEIISESSSKEIELTLYKNKQQKSFDVSSQNQQGTLLKNLIKKTEKRNQTNQKPHFITVNNILRQFIMLIVGLPILESSYFNLDFKDEEYQRELSKKNFLVRMLNKRPIVSVILYIITLCTGIMYMISTIWYVVENEIDPEIKNNLLKDSLMVVLCIIWVSLGTFSISVLYNIFCSADMKDAIKNETKSFFKIPAWFILLLLVCLFIYCATDNMDLEKCEAKDSRAILLAYVCHLRYYSSILYLFIGCFWNYLVAIIIMMISKTHTKLIRMFLTNIELDNLNIFRVSDIMLQKSNFEMIEDIEQHQHYAYANDLNSLNELECETPMNNDDLDMEGSIVTMANKIRKRFDTTGKKLRLAQELRLSMLDLTQSNGIGSKYIEEHLKMNRLKLEECMNKSPETCPACLYRFSNQNSVRNCSRVFCVHIMHPNEILMYFSKILYVLRLTSALTQRWTTAYVTCTLMWLVINLISWIDEKPSFTNILQFILPFIILGVVCGIFAETNAEGKKLIRSITPLDERINMIAYVGINPLEMTVYGFVIDYKVEVQVIGAFAIGFISQIILHEMKL